MRRYRFFQAFYKSFYSCDLYRDVENNWGAEVVWYLALLLAFCWIVTVVNIQGAFTRSYEQLAAIITPQLPIIHIKEGRTITPENRPYIIKNPQTQEILIVIDTSGKYQSLSQIHTMMLLTKDKISYQVNAKEVKLRQLPNDLTLQIVPAEAKEVIGSIIKWSWVLFFPLLLLLSFLYRVIQAFVYALLGKFFALLADIPLSYMSIVKLSMVALTPAIVLGTLFGWFNITFHFQWLFYFILSMSYLVFAIRIHRKKRKGQ